MVEVVLELFSGRPDPTWSLTSEEAAVFHRLISQLAPAQDGAGPSVDGLGYRGIGARWTDPHAGDMHLRASGGRVAITTGRSRRVFTDAHRLLERWLLGTGLAKVDAALRPTLRAVLDDLDADRPR